MAYEFGRGNYHGSQGDTSSVGGGMGVGYGNERVQDNLAKAFSLLEDDKPKTGYPGQSPYNYAGDNRIGTAPSGGYGMQRSNYTGSDFGDSEQDRRSNPPMRPMTGAGLGLGLQ